MNELVTFKFEENIVRTITIENEPWFVLTDICNVLDIVNPSSTVKQLDMDEKSTLRITEGGPERNIVNESGLYSVILMSRKPEAKRFKKWITAEVLPSIRKTGQYSLKEKLLPSEVLLQSIQLLVDMERKQLEIEKRVKAIEERPVINAQIEHFSIMGYCHNIGRQISLRKSQRLSWKCKSRCNELHLDIGKISDPRFGTVNTYPLNVLKEIIR
jgi:prophage antirepressor-like protein